MNDTGFTASLATTPEDLDAVYRLRYEDLVMEYRTSDGSPDEQYIDRNSFDDYADHIMVKNNRTGEVVGYYRMIRSDALLGDRRFICEDEFNIDKLKSLPDGICEFSRAVIKKSYRGGMILLILWKFILGYMREHGYRYLIGDASFFGTDRTAYREEISYLARNYPISPNLEIRSLDTLPPMELSTCTEYDSDEMLRRLPPLIKGYANLGARFSTDTFTDFPFGSVDVFVLLDLENANRDFIGKLERFGLS